MTEQLELDKPTFYQFKRLIYDHAGIALSDRKEILVSVRVGKRLHELGINSYRKYYQIVKNDETKVELGELLNVIATNTTHFYRENRHFTILKRIIKKWEDNGQMRFRIWSAASSTGEEPYTIAITLKEALENTLDTKILATDISTKVLQKAKSGIYEKRQVEKIPSKILNNHFKKIIHSGEEKYQVNPDLQKMITFGRINLSTFPYPLHGPLDVIFCRNVMIYFDNAVRRKLLNEMYKLLKPGGYLFVGHAESLSGMLSDFKNVEPSVYTK